MALRFVLAAALVAVAAANDAPFMAQIDADGTTCQGALIKSNKVMTTAACLKGKSADVTVRVGGETIPGTASVNPYFEGECLQNIAIVTLKQDAATPCANPNSYKKVDNGASIVGAFFEGGNLKTVPMERLDDKSCQRAMTGAQKSEFDMHVVCAKPAGGFECTPGAFAFLPGSNTAFGMIVDGDCKATDGSVLFLDIVNREVRDFVNEEYES